MTFLLIFFYKLLILERFITLNVVIMHCSSSSLQEKREQVSKLATRLLAVVQWRISVTLSLPELNEVVDQSLLTCLIPRIWKP